MLFCCCCKVTFPFVLLSLYRQLLFLSCFFLYQVSLTWWIFFSSKKNSHSIRVFPCTGFLCEKFWYLKSPDSDPDNLPHLTSIKIIWYNARYFTVLSGPGPSKFPRFSPQDCVGTRTNLRKTWLLVL